MKANYPMYHIMAISRLKRMKIAKGRCEICGERGDVLHHRDFKTTNHRISNLILLCVHCHEVIHHPHKEVVYVLHYKYERGRNWRKSAKITRLFGLTISQLVHKYGKTAPYWRAQLNEKWPKGKKARELRVKKFLKKNEKSS